MNIYDPDDDGLDDDNPYDYSNVNNEEAKEDIARMQLRQNRATEAEIIELLSSLSVKYSDYKNFYAKSDAAKSIAFEKDIAKYNKIINSQLIPDYVFHYISLAAIQRAKQKLKARMDFESEIDGLEREYNRLYDTQDPKGKKLEYLDICPGVQASIPYLKYVEIYIQNAPKINFQNYQKAKQSKDKLDKAENKVQKKLDEIIKTTKDIYAYKEHLKANYEELKHNPNENEAKILRKAELMFENIDKQLKTRLTAYLNYAPESKLKNEIKKVSSSGYFGINLNRNYITELFEKINDGTIKLNTPCQGE